jgi:hypothetical protein
MALGLERLSAWEAEHYGGGFFPTLCLIVAALCLAAGIGCLFQRGFEFLVRACRLIAEWII